MPDPIHQTLATVQTSLTASHSAESADGTVRAEATAKRQTALHLSPGALRLSPGTLAALILTTQQEAQKKAEAALTEHLNTFREDPRVANALTTLQDTQATPTHPKTRTKTTPNPPAENPQGEEEEEETFINSIYNSNNNW